METSWVDLLDKSGVRKSPQRSRLTVKVSESTPKGKVGTKWNNPGTYNHHGRAVISTVNGEVVMSERLLMESQKQLRECQLQLAEQSRLIEHLSSDNDRLAGKSHDLEQAFEQKKNLCIELERTKSSLALAQLTATQLEKNLEEKEEAMEGILAHVHSLQTEVQHLSSSSRQHGSNILLTDMERLTRQNAELCERLAATQHSRTVLERELVSVKRGLLEEKAVSGKLEQLLAKTIEERDEVGAELDDKLKTILENLQQERIGQERHIESLAQSKAEALGQLEETQRELAALKETQLREIEKRCAEVDNMKQQLQKELVNLQAERSEFSQQLGQMERERDGMRSQLLHSTKLAEQLKNENQAITAQVEQVQSKFERERENMEKTNRILQDQLEQTATEFEAALAEAETTKTTNILLQQQVTDLTAQVSGMKEQLSGRCELTNEMKALLDQRAARIRELEKTIARQKRELSVSMETSSEIFNASRESQDDIISETSSMTSLSPGRTRSSRFTASHAEVLHLKQRLSESRRQTVSLEVQLAQVKTENAKLLGSQQAMAAIKNQVTEENGKLTAIMREREGYWEKERESLTGIAREREEAWRREREGLVNEVNQVNLKMTELEREAEKEKEMLLSRMRELEAEKREEDVAGLERLLEEEREKSSLLEDELAKLSQLVDKEVAVLKNETHQYADTISALRAEAMQLQETSRITEVVNSTRARQIEEREESVGCLLGEVEALRAKKNVVEKFLQQRTACNEELLTRENKELASEVQELKEQLKHCTCANESHDLIEQSHDLGDHTHQDRLSKLLLRLKSQKRQTNFVRMKLGYALSELRLYKQLKVAMDNQIAKLQESVCSLQERYHNCLERLSQAEALGFGGVTEH